MCRLIAGSMAWICVVVAVGSIAVVGEPGEPSEQPARVLSGQVLNHMGSGIRDAGVTVELRASADAEPVQLTTATDALGDFSVELPAGFSGRAVVKVSKDLYAPATSELDIGALDLNPFVFFELEGNTTLEGLVQREDTAAPIAGAHVAVTDDFRDWEADTDDAGRFKIDKLPPGGLRITVTADGFAKYKKGLRSRAPGESLTIALGPEWVAKVRLTDGSGQPVSEAVVEALLSDNSDLLTEMSDQAGRVTFAGLPPTADSIRLRIHHPDFVKMLDFEHLIARPVDGALVEADIEVVRAARVVGRVTDAATGEPVAMARVMVGEYITSGVPMSWTDPDGRYEVTGVAPGEALVTVHDPEHAPAIGRVETEAGAEAVLNLRLSAGVTIRGRVLDEEDRPVAEAQVTIESWEGYRTVGLKALTDASGEFEIAHAPRGDVRLGVYAPGYEPAQVVAAGEELRVVLQKRKAPEPPQLGEALAVGETAPDVAVTTLDGRRIELAKLRGKYVFLDFWATWCVPCVIEVPNVKKLHEKTAGRPDFLLVGVSLDLDKAALQRFIKDKGITWPQVVEEGGAAAAAEAFKVYAIPATFLIGPDGRIIATDLRGEELADEATRLTDKNSSSGK